MEKVLEKETEIDFTKIKLKGRQVMIEYPTETNFGIIMINDQDKSLQSGWFIVRAVSDAVKESAKKEGIEPIKEGQEAFVFFHHKPYEFDEIVLQSRKEQKEFVDKEQTNDNKKIIMPNNPFNKYKEKKIPRQFGIVSESSVLMTREYESV